ncbi:hypothetical protein [Algoriphagus taiwanensis]|uniref:Uncharacterized protein n=1 Tax=Algoriphagus taiwanensis TaxID=1445656 RepID=A0ABQ6PV72_9BACT|nr:hypothetical protein Ataiwa_01300 [Algoriphagus taiwanensis]
MKICFYSIICICFIFSCKQIDKKNSFHVDKSNTYPEEGDTLLIVFDSEDSLSYKREEKIGEKIMFSYRKNFKRSPDLIVAIGNSYDHKKIIILRENLNRYPILYDSALDFIKWFYVNYDSYFLIEKKNLFNSNSDSLQFLEVSYSSKGEI